MTRAVLDEHELAKRSFVLEHRAARRDYQAIAACGLCDANGFVVVDLGAIPTVDFCAHRTTIAAVPDPDRVDLV